MNRVVITGVGVLSPAGVGTAALQAALEAERPLGETLEYPMPRGRARPLRVAKVPPFDRERYLPARKLRRMGELSQLWTLACLLAREDAGLGGDASRSPAPALRGTFLGTGLGCTDTTWDYLEGMFRDGMAAASPYLFAESVANAPAGHSAIELDARGICVTLTCADASAAAAIAMGARALGEGRLQLAYCGGAEILSAPLLRALAPLGGPSHLGEGAACLVLETFGHARDRGARILAEVGGVGLCSDPLAPANSWSVDRATFATAMRRALDTFPEGSGKNRSTAGLLMLHACGWAASDQAERLAAEEVFPGVPQRSLTPVVGTLAAAGGFCLGMAAACEVERHRSVLLHAHGWGGSAYAMSLGALTD